MEIKKTDSYRNDNTVNKHVDDSREKGNCAGWLIFVAGVFVLIFMFSKAISSFYSGRYVETPAVIKSMDLEPSGYDGRYRRHSEYSVIKYIVNGISIEKNIFYLTMRNMFTMKEWNSPCYIMLTILLI